jgi:hypothetical protein
MGGGGSTKTTYCIILGLTTDMIANLELITLSSIIFILFTSRPKVSSQERRVCSVHERPNSHGSLILYIYICLCTCINTYMNMYINTYTYIYTYIYTHMYVYIYMYTYKHINVYITYHRSTASRYHGILDDNNDDTYIWIDI